MTRNRCIFTAMSKKIFRLALLLLVATLYSCTKVDTTGRELIILSEVMKPYNYEENGQQKGITIEVIRYILQELDLTNPIQISNDWDAIFDRLKTEDNIAAITTALTPERKAHFKWVGPVTLWNVGFVALPSSGISINSAEEAKQYGPVGIVKSYFTGEILRDLGFTALVEYGDLEELVEALFDGSVTVIFDNMSLLQIIVQDNPQYQESLANLLTYSTTQGYIAFSANVSDRIISNWQKKLDEMKDSGLLQSVYDDYLPGTRAPGRVTIFTELNPPQSYIDREGTLTGSAVEMIQAMMDVMDINDPIESTHWSNAFDQIKLVPNSLAFPTILTTEREKSFKWVGPVCKKNYVFVVSSFSSHQITRIDDARALSSVATMTGWASEEELIGLGFTNLVTFPTPLEVMQKLLNGEVAAAVLNDIAIGLLLDELDKPMDAVRIGAVLSSGETYLAFSADTDRDYLKKWESAYQAIRKSGKFAEIWNRWYPLIDWQSK